MPTNPTRSRATLRTPRYDGSTGRPRRGIRPWSALAGGLALALVLGSGIAVASGSAAQAHDADYKTTCAGVTVEAWSYAGAGGAPGQRNTITFEVDSQPTQTVEFDGSKTQYFAFPNSMEEHTYSVTVNAWNDPTHSSWNKKWLNLKSTPCIPPSIVGLSAPQCDVTGSTTDLTATFEKLVAGRTYSLKLDSNAPTSTTVDYTPAQTTGTYTWPGVTPGLSYTVTITDTTNRDLTASTSVTLLGCPDQSGVSITPTECTAPGQSATFSVTADSLVTGRQYRIDIYNAGTNAIVDTLTFTAAGATQTHAYAAAPSGSYYATVIDTAEVGGTPVTSGTYKFLPCPDQLTGPALDVTQCNVVSTGTGGRIQVAVTDLVPGRTYNIVVSDGNAVVVLNQLNYFASSDTFTADLTVLPAGTYTATVTDVLEPSFTSTSSAVLLPCPTTDTEIDLSGTTCTVPGDKSDLTATISDYAVGRAYTVTLTLANVAVGSPQQLDSSSGLPQVIVFAGLKPGTTYRVIVSDDLASPPVTAAADIALAACPGDPAIALTPGECSVLGASNISVALDKLVSGEVYDVTVVTTATGNPVPGVASQKIAATLPTLSLLFKNLPNGSDYTITVENVAKTLSATARIFLEVCDLPTFDLPTLAFTGTNTLPPTLAGLGFLQLGIMLVGVAVIRRRSGAREA